MIAVLLIAAFLIGSIPTGMLIARAKGVDLRKIGSGNIGATNVLRAAGRAAALLTLAGDIVKGVIPVLAARALQSQGIALSGLHLLVPEGSDPALVAECLAGLAAVLGHNFSVFLRFRGGKGVATSLGVLFALTPLAALATVTIWLLTLSKTMYSSLSALVSFGLLPIFVYVIDPLPEKVVVSVILAVMIFLRHSGNIRRLLNGTEAKVGSRK